MWTAALLTALPLATAGLVTVKRAPLYTPRDDIDAIDGKYIVKMKESNEVSLATINDALASITAEASAVFNTLGGFAAALTPEEVEVLRDDPNVEYIEQQTEFRLMTTTQENVTWGLARLCHFLPGSTTYEYEEAAGEGVCAYVLDTGIDINHPDLEGRATLAATFVDGIEVDDQGHGTHVAGTIGSATYGVAKKVDLFAVKVFNSEGGSTNELIMRGIDAILTDAPTRNCPNGVVINMSFGGKKSQAINDAAATLVKAGYFVGAAAGNGHPIFGNPEDVRLYSPGGEPLLCTVGASDEEDWRVGFSNVGPGVDIHAPGWDIMSLLPGNATGLKTGTSMATAHVVGLAAYFMSLGIAATDACEHMTKIGQWRRLVGMTNGTPNVIAQNGLSEW